MRLRPLHVPALLALAVAAACSGGGSGTSAASLNCPDSVLCLVSCNLGCDSNGCTRTAIAPNETLTWVFDKAVDPASVQAGGIQIRDGSGASAQGDFTVTGSTVTFQPSIAAVGSTVVFGFHAGETYSLQLPAGGLRSTAGALLQKPLACTLRVGTTPNDTNGRAPTCELTSPPSLVAVPTDSLIQLRFDELLTLPSFSTTGANDPITFASHGIRTLFGMRACDPSTPAVYLPGTVDVTLDTVRQTTTVTFASAGYLPRDMCVEVIVTDGVHGISGQSAQPARYTFLTGAGPAGGGSSVVTVEETFDNATQLDTEYSAADWSSGLATFPTLGGDGLHGEFDVSLGTDLGVVGAIHSYSINCDNTVIPATRTLDGQAYTVANGKFRFTRMVVPANTRIVFTGTNPPQISVRGRLQVDGILDLKGETTAYYVPGTAATGQVGGLGGAAGGRGGQGGDKCNGTGANAAHNGRNGEDVKLQSGHAYTANAVGTGGRGSPLFPSTGLNANLVYNSGTVPYTLMTAAGGGGGGFLAAGSAGRVVYNTRNEARASGTSSGSNTTTLLNDTTKAWGVNEWVGGRLTITAGTASGQTALVLSNTATQLTLATALTLVPDTTSKYAIVPVSTGSNTATTLLDTRRSWTTNEWAGMRVTITAGTGIGQSKLIVSNTATELTVDSAWTTIPDATSSYQLPLVALMASPQAGGIALPNLPIGQGASPSSLHFLIGGSGGGGGGSQPTFCNSFSPAWAPGSGGGGGGGAIALRAGGSLGVGSTGQILANGGGAGVTTGGAVSAVLPSVGGGGSGGSVLLQCSGTVSVAGLVDVRGGAGGSFNRSTALAASQGGGTAEAVGGAGAPGFIRLEALTPLTTVDLPQAQPPATGDNIGTLNESDDRVGFQSQWYELPEAVAMTYTRYQVVALVNNQQLSYGSLATETPARFGSAPIQIYFQTATRDIATGNLVTGSASAWRDDLGGLVLNSVVGNRPVLRFQVLVDRLVASQVQLDGVQVLFRRAP